MQFPLLPTWISVLVLGYASVIGVQAACVDNTTDTQGLQKLLNEGGVGYVLSLCQGQVYSIDQSLNFTNTSQVRALVLWFYA
jgi:hypothetical protein